MEVREELYHRAALVSALATTTVDERAGTLPRLTGGERTATHVARRRAGKHEPIAVAAHELRTPLSTLNVTIELLADHPQLATDELRELVTRLQRGVSWMNGLVENLDTWSALCENRLTIRHAPVSVLAWIESAVAVTRPMLDRRGQHTRVICPTPAPSVLGDAARLGQVVANLITNASKYGVWGDEICISVTSEDDWVRITIGDHGPGISPEEQCRIFDRYARGTGAAEAARDGHGLGLYIVRRLVELHGGSVGVDSAPGDGATFWFTLPRDAERRCAD